MFTKRIPLFLSVIACLSALTVFGPGTPIAYPQNSHAHQGNMQVGYVIITPTSNNTSGLAAFETFGESRGNETTQAGVLPSSLTTEAMIFVTASNRLSRNLGIAVVNPQSSAASVTFTLHGSDGTAISTKTITINSHNQIAQFVTQIFANQPAVQGEFNGTIIITSTAPVAIVGLRFRGINFSTVPVTIVGPTSQMPMVATNVGGTGSLILPQFADGGGWAAEIVLSNFGTLPLTVRADLFNQDGTPLTVSLNGVTANSFTSLTIPPAGVVILAPVDTNGDDEF